MARSSEASGATKGGRVLAILLLAYIFNFIDRQIIGILAVPIKADLGLSDTELGLMGGLAFALFYTGLGIPIAWLADRKSRVTIIAVSLTLWSAFTAVCGFAQNFWQLFLARMGVGVGEAGGVAPCYALVADLFPARAARPRARHLLAGHADRIGVRHLLRRLDREPYRLARGVHDRRRARPADRSSGQVRDQGPGARRLRQCRRRGLGARPLVRHRVQDARDQAELLAARVRIGVRLDRRLRPDLLAALLLQAQLRPRPCRRLLFLRLAGADRRRDRRLLRRRARRPDRQDQARRLRAHPGDLLPARRARQRARPVHAPR